MPDTAPTAAERPVVVAECRPVSAGYVAPHGPDEPCLCPGCWACDGLEMGCTCDIDWDAMAEARLDR